VTATSGSDAWAVGQATTGGVASTLTLHWNGTAWSWLASLNPAPADRFFQFFAVGASSARDAWMAGASGDEHTFQSFAIHRC